MRRHLRVSCIILTRVTIYMMLTGYFLPPPTPVDTFIVATMGATTPTRHAESHRTYATIAFWRDIAAPSPAMPALRPGRHAYTY